MSELEAGLRSTEERLGKREEEAARLSSLLSATRVDEDGRAAASKLAEARGRALDASNRLVAEGEKTLRLQTELAVRPRAGGRPAGRLGV